MVSTIFLSSLVFVTAVTGSNCEGSECQYSFSYPADKQSGYYVVGAQWCPADSCSDCIGAKEACSDGVLYLQNASRAEALYGINEGYKEDFVYDSKYPVYGAWEIRDFDDFSNTCFVGDCNKYNIRHVICIDDSYQITDQTYTCSKWINPSSGTSTHYCVNGLYVNSGTGEPRSGFDWAGECKNPTLVNFYYVYNNFKGKEGYIDFEGYSPDWKGRWENNFNDLRSYVSQFGVVLEANYYDVALEDDSAIPSAIFDRVLGNHEAYRPGDLHVTIHAGKQNALDYGFDCLGDYPRNPCRASAGGIGIGIPDQYDFSRKQGASTLIHEYGHSFGCPHTGAPGSLGSHLYVNDIMSYGDSSEEFLYECRIAQWLLGKQEESNFLADAGSSGIWIQREFDESLKDLVEDIGSDESVVSNSTSSLDVEENISMENLVEEPETRNIHLDEPLDTPEEDLSEDILRNKNLSYFSDNIFKKDSAISFFWTAFFVAGVIFLFILLWVVYLIITRERF